jgi:hypothetical protein
VKENEGGRVVLSYINWKREGERVCLRVCERKREIVCVCVCVRERERESNFQFWQAISSFVVDQNDRWRKKLIRPN